MTPSRGRLEGAEHAYVQPNGNGVYFYNGQIITHLGESINNGRAILYINFVHNFDVSQMAWTRLGRSYDLPFCGCIVCPDRQQVAAIAIQVSRTGYL